MSLLAGSLNMERVQSQSTDGQQRAHLSLCPRSNFHYRLWELEVTAPQTLGMRSSPPHCPGLFLTVSPLHACMRLLVPSYRNQSHRSCHSAGHRLSGVKVTLSHLLLPGPDHSFVHPCECRPWHLHLCLSLWALLQVMRLVCDPVTHSVCVSGTQQTRGVAK